MQQAWKLRVLLENSCWQLSWRLWLFRYRGSRDILSRQNRISCYKACTKVSKLCHSMQTTIANLLPDILYKCNLVFFLVFSDILKTIHVTKLLTGQNCFPRVLWCYWWGNKTVIPFVICERSNSCPSVSGIVFWTVQITFLSTSGQQDFWPCWRYLMHFFFLFSSPKMLRKCEVCYSLKLVLTPNESHWPYQGGNSTFLGEFI